MNLPNPAREVRRAGARQCSRVCSIHTNSRTDRHVRAVPPLRYWRSVRVLEQLGRVEEAAEAYGDRPRAGRHCAKREFLKDIVCFLT